MGENDRKKVKTADGMAEDPAPFDSDGDIRNDEAAFDEFWADKTAEDRAAYEAAVEEGIRQADAGLLIPHGDVRAWLLSLGTANPLPKPRPRKQTI